MTTEKEIGEKIGSAMARDVLANDMPREWAGLDAQDVDQIPDGCDQDKVEEAARLAYARALKVAENLVCGKQIQHDRSGVGHCWRNVGFDDLPANIREEIECEIIDGKKEECDDYVASNGLHYRW